MHSGSENTFLPPVPGPLWKLKLASSEWLHDAVASACQVGWLGHFLFPGEYASIKPYTGIPNFVVSVVPSPGHPL